MAAAVDSRYQSKPDLKIWGQGLKELAMLDRSRHFSPEYVSEALGLPPEKAIALVREEQQRQEDKWDRKIRKQVAYEQALIKANDPNEVQKAGLALDL